MKARTRSMLGLLCLALPLAATSANEPINSDMQEASIVNGFVDLIATVKPAIVNIKTKSLVAATEEEEKPPEASEYVKKLLRRKNTSSEESNRKNWVSAQGTGFAISENGLIVTNAHVIGKAAYISVTLQNGKTYQANIEALDEDADIALLRIGSGTTLPYLKFGDSDEALPGSWVIAIGNPFGLGASASAGIISARGGNAKKVDIANAQDYIQIDALINRGSSGGPLFNTKGEVIGINTSIYSPTGENIGIGFSMPSNYVKYAVKKLGEEGVVEQVWLGLHIQGLNGEVAKAVGLEDAMGALVSEVVEESPAKKAGLLAGDVIRNYGGEKIVEANDLPKLIARTNAGEKVLLVVWRENHKKTIEVVVEKAETVRRKLERELELSFAALTKIERKKYIVGAGVKGVIVSHVEKKGAADKQKIRKGDVITKVGGNKIENIADLEHAYTESLKNNGQSLAITIYRKRRKVTVNVPFNQG